MIIKTIVFSKLRFWMVNDVGSQKWKNRTEDNISHTKFTMWLHETILNMCSLQYIVSCSIFVIDEEDCIAAVSDET